MRIVPVLDLQSGKVVRGIGGRRHEYQPIVSRLIASHHPVEVARAFRDQLGLTELYLADLDAVGGAAPALPIYRAIREIGCRLWVDAGLRQAAEAATVAEADVEQIVVGLETVDGPEVLAEIVRDRGSERLVFSLDLLNGRPLGNVAAWGNLEVEAIAGRVVELGLRRLIVLDLAQVGTGGGIGTETLCRCLAARHPGIEVIAGGGLRDAEDLRRLQRTGIAGVLVASALHDGRLTRQDWMARAD